MKSANGLLVVAMCFGLQAQSRYDARLASLEAVMDRFYRGERLEEAVDRSDQGIRAYNADAVAQRAEVEKGRAHLEKMMEQVEKDRGRLKTLDQELKQLSEHAGPDAIKERVGARNALARQINEESARARQATEAYNALVRRVQQRLEENRKKAMEVQANVDARLAAFSAFTQSGQDVAFFLELNRLLAGIRQKLRENSGDQALLAQLDRVRGLRRELATWAMAGYAHKPNGLVVVEATVGDEPCWFIVDTGAMDTIISEEILDAIGLGKNLGKEMSLSVVGGVRVTGLACRIPRLVVGGQMQLGVSASAVRPSDVGIDGLLGQSFLKFFVYTIDERNPSKLLLERR